ELDSGSESLDDVRRREIEPIGEPVDLDRDAGLLRHAEDLGEVERVLGPAVEGTPRRMGEGARRRRARRLDGHARALPAAPALAGVETQLDPVELGEDGVLRVERAVGADVALDAP